MDRVYSIQCMGMGFHTFNPWPTLIHVFIFLVEKQLTKYMVFCGSVKRSDHCLCDGNHKSCRVRMDRRVLGQITEQDNWFIFREHLVLVRVVFLGGARKHTQPVAKIRIIPGDPGAITPTTGLLGVKDKNWRPCIHLVLKCTLCDRGHKWTAETHRRLQVCLSCIFPRCPACVQILSLPSSLTLEVQMTLRAFMAKNVKPATYLYCFLVFRPHTSVLLSIFWVLDLRVVCSFCLGLI